MANHFTATQRSDVGHVAPSATKILGARDQDRQRGAGFGEQLENAARNRSETAARDRRDSIAQRDRNESRAPDSGTQADRRDDRMESRREADRSENGGDRARETRERTDEDTRSQDSNENAEKRGSTGEDNDSGTSSKDTAQTPQPDEQTDTATVVTSGDTTFLDSFGAVIASEAASADAQTEGANTLDQTVVTTQSQNNPLLLGGAAGITGAVVAAQTPTATGLSHRPTQAGAAIPGLPLDQSATPTGALGADLGALASGDELQDGEPAKQGIQSDRTFERALATRNALAANENNGANGFQAASTARNGDLTIADPTTLPVGATPQGQAGNSGTIIRMVPATMIGQAATVPVHTMAFHIARNVDNGVNRFEIRVDPPELGKIDVTMDVQSDGKVRVHMVVERAEALDFLQRDARALEKALSDAGLDADTDSVSFSLEQNEKETGGNHNDEFDAGDNGGIGDDEEPASFPASGTQPQYLSTTAVDIRI